MNAYDVKGLNFEKLLAETRLRLGFLKKLVEDADPVSDEQVLVDTVWPVLIPLVEFLRSINVEEEDDEDEDVELGAELGAELGTRQASPVLIEFPGRNGGAL